MKNLIKYSQETPSIAEQAEDLYLNGKSEDIVNFCIAHDPSKEPYDREKLKEKIISRMHPQFIIKYFENIPDPNVSVILANLATQLDDYPNRDALIYLSLMLGIPGVDHKLIINSTLEISDHNLLTAIGTIYADESNANKFLEKIIKTNNLHDIVEFITHKFNIINIDSGLVTIARLTTHTHHISECLYLLKEQGWKLSTDLAIKLMANHTSQNLLTTIFSFDSVNISDLFKFIIIDNGFSYVTKEDTISKIINENKLSVNEIINIITTQTNNIKALKALLNVIKRDQISFEFNMNIIQLWIEKNAKITDLQEIIDLNILKLNFPSIKKKFNELAAKNPGTQHTIEYLKNNNSYDQSFIDHLIKNKDYFYLETDNLNIFASCKLILNYLRIKEKTLINLYDEAFKKDYNLLLQFQETQDELIEYYKEYREINNEIDEQIIASSQNIYEYLKYCKKMLAAAEIKHNSGVFLPILIKAIFNKSFDIEDQSNEELLEIIQNIKYNIPDANINFTEDNMIEYLATIDGLNEQAGREIINRDNFENNAKIIFTLINKFDNNEKISWKKNSIEHIALKQIHTDLALVKDFPKILKYIKQARPKDPKLFDFEISINDFNFKVLKFLDPYAFKVGIDTGCCQRLGGEGWAAAVDSFINPYAGVLILTKNGALISQSYFHYVPQDNGLILDNVEENTNNMNKLHLNAIKLAKIYADYAAAIKTKYPKLKYILCGKDHTKIDESSFKSEKMKEDPRHFESEEEYSDFNEDDHLNLLAPSTSLNNVIVASYNIFNKIYNIIKSSDIRKIALRLIK